jgi:hypothetical protein
VQEQPALTDAPDPKWAQRLVEETADGMGAGQFSAVQGSWCQVCAVKACCPVQPEGEAL